MPKHDQLCIVGKEQNDMWRHQLANKTFPIADHQITAKLQEKLFQRNLHFAIRTQTLFEIFPMLDNDLIIKCIYNDIENDWNFPVKWSDFDVAFWESINRCVIKKKNKNLI